MEMEWPEPSADLHKIVGEEIIKIIGTAKLDEEFYNYAINFNKAAHIITEYVLDTARISSLDINFFALAYLYRHSLDLILKAVTPFIKPQLDKDTAAYNWLVAYFNDASTIDKESDSFRYPFGIQVAEESIYFEAVKRYSIRAVFDEQKHIDLVAFANKMEITFELLEGIYKGTYGANTDYQQYDPTFLEEGGDYYSQSVVGYKYDAEDFYRHVTAYTDCAERLYKSVVTDKSLKEALFFPMCYLYRNAVELSLKRVLFEECSFSIQEALESMHDKKHSIHALWTKIKIEVIRHADAPKDDTTIENVERYIKQLHDFDGASAKFRYPIDKYLQLYFKGQKKFDITNVNKFFLELLTFLDAVDGMMSEHNKAMAEMQVEAQSYCDPSDYYDPRDYYDY